MVESEIYVLVPASFYDFANAGPRSALGKLLGCGRSTRPLRDLHLQMVIYAKTRLSQGFVPDYEIGRLAYPDSQASAKRTVLRLIDIGLVEPVEGGYYVPAAEEWPPVQRTGTRDRIPAYTRDLVFERDGYRCQECGSADDLTLDHVIPWSKNGPDTEENLRTLCGSCNSRKAARV